MKKDIEKLMNAIPRKNGREKYSSFDEVMEDYKSEKELLLKEHIIQDENPVEIFSDNRELVKEMEEMDWAISRTDFNEGNIEIASLNKPVLEFVKYDLCCFARNNRKALLATCNNPDAGSFIRFRISEKGELSIDAEYEYSRNCPEYLACTVMNLKNIYGSLEEMKSCMKETVL